MGTHGYAAPDYIKTGHLTSKSDVWSFGVVLYEILTGRQSFERNRPKSEQKLLDWVKHFPFDSKKFDLIMDPRLGNKYSSPAARKIAKLADSCLVTSAKDRPAMSRVVEILKHIIQVSSDCDSSTETFVFSDDEPVEQNKSPKQERVSESAKRRMLHLATLGDHVNGLSKRGFMIMQRTKVP